MEWTAERVDTLLKRWMSGDTGTDIAREFGVSRNTIAGKLNRLRCKGLIKRLSHDELCRRVRAGGAKGGQTRAKEMWAGHVKGTPDSRGFQKPKPKPKPVKRSPTRKVGVLFPDDPASRAAFALLARAEAAESRCNAWRRAR